MAKNKDININPSKGISIVIKNDIQQPPPIKPKKKRTAPQQPITINLGDYMRALIPQEYTSSKPESRFQEIDNGLDINDTFYQALPQDKKEEYQNAKLEDITKNIDETAEKAAADIENTDFYKTKLDAPTQAATKEKSKYLTIQQKLEGMKEGSIKGIATKDINNLNEPRYPQNKMYREFYKKGLKNQEDIINKRIQELDDIVARETGQKQARAETEIITKTNQLRKIETLYNKMKSEKKKELRIY